MNENRIEKLRQIIYSNLDPLIDGDYCLLDVPAHENIGDNLIWFGELEYLKRLPHKMVYTSNSDLCNFSKVKKADVVLLQGGGNFGDLWELYQPFRMKVIQECKDKKVILFPQSVYYKDHKNLLEDAKVFNEHPNLILCARDEQSFSIFQKYFTAKKILFLPDMAFCLDLRNRVESKQQKRVLILKRSDKELHNSFNEELLLKSISPDVQVDVKDWPSFQSKDDGKPKTAKKIYSLHGLGLSKVISKLPLLNKLVDDRYGFVFRVKRTMEDYVETGINFINQYDEIYATRLHVFILSILLQKKVHIFDNSYGKNSGLYNAWLRDFDNVEMIDYSKLTEAINASSST